jgi:glyoxylase-like metal-dependent hydrolase (beta-lactamase superfamily II)
LFRLSNSGAWNTDLLSIFYPQSTIYDMNIVNVGYDSTNYYLLEPDTIGLLIDVGWPVTLPKLLSILKRKGVAFQKIKYLLVTHYHPDHAGLAQEMKEQGVQLIVMRARFPLSQHCPDT